MKNIAFLISLVVLPYLASLLNGLLFSHEYGKLKLILLIGYYISNTIGLVGLLILKNLIKNRIEPTIFIEFIILIFISAFIFISMGADLLNYLPLPLTYILVALGYFGIKKYLKDIHGV